MKKPLFSSLMVLPMLLFLYCGKINPPMPKIFSGKIDVSTIKLPDGFNIEIYAENVVNARSMALSPPVYYLSVQEIKGMYMHWLTKTVIIRQKNST